MNRITEKLVPSLIKNDRRSENIGSPPLSYDALLKQSPQASIYAHRWWLNAVAPGKYHILEIRNGSGLQAAWPVVYLEGESGKHICMPPLTQKLGILFAPSSAKPVELQSTHQRLTKELLDHVGEFVSFHQNFHENFTDWLMFYWNGYTQTSRYTYVVEDVSDIDQLWSNMRANCRQNIRKAQKLGITIKDNLELSEFLKLNHKTFSRQGMQPLATEELICRLDAACCANAGRKIFAGVDTQGRVHAAVYIAWANNTAYYLMGGSEPGLRESCAQILALWEALVFSSSVVKRFDFEGSMLPQVERVFRGLGAKQLPYFSITKSPQPPTSLSGFLKASLRFRWQKARRTLARRLKQG
jgi:hypothetical protein